MSVFPKKVLVVPRKKAISGILPNNKRIIDPMEISVMERELRHLLNVADVYEIQGDKKIVLSLQNYTLDNSVKEPEPTVVEHKKPVIEKGPTPVKVEAKQQSKQNYNKYDKNNKNKKNYSNNNSNQSTPKTEAADSDESTC